MAQRNSLTQALQQDNRDFVSDGAWGTLLAENGLQPGECPEQWCLTHEQAVREVAAAYAATDCDAIKCNSFGANTYKLQHYGLEENTYPISKQAAFISRSEAKDTQWVLAPVGPSGKMLFMGEIDENELYEAFKEQVRGLEAGGTDVILVETMIDVTEACLAVRAAKQETSCEVAATFTFDQTEKGEFRTMMGNLPADAAADAVSAGADIIGANCGCGFGQMTQIVQQMREALPRTPILIHANAGMPQLIEGKEVYPETPDIVASYVPELIEAGVSMIGGCCGTSPAHIKALRDAVRKHSK